MTNEKAIQIIKNMIHDDIAVYGNKPKLRNEALALAVKALEERPQGEWTDLSTDGRHTGWIACSVCGQEPPSESNLRTDFCPNCGADMRKGDKE